MTPTKTKLIVVFVVCTACVVPVRAVMGDVLYSVVDLGVLSGPGSFPTAINNIGQVVGYGDTYTMYSHAFLYNGSGPLVNLGSWGGDYSVSAATGINNSGTVIGYSDQGGTNPTVAFVYTQSGGMQPIVALGGAQSNATAINNNGQIVGQYVPANSSSFDGFIYTIGGAMTDIAPYIPYCINDAGLVAASGPSGTAGTATGTFISSGGTGTWVNIGSLGGTYTVPDGMNNLGEVVGGSSITGGPGHQQPFMYSGGKMTDLGTFGGANGMANGINNLGVVVGGAAYANNPNGAGFVWYGSGSIQDLNDLVDPSLDWTITDALAINDQGQIAAAAYQPGQDFHAVLLTPIQTPEPSSFGLLLAAIIGLSAAHYGARILRGRR